MSPANTAEPTLLQTRIQALEAENRRLALRVQDLQQQLAAKHGARHPVDPAVAAATLSLFQEPDLGEPAVGPAVPRAPRSARRRAAGSAPRGRQPLDPALPRETTQLPDPPAAARFCPVTRMPLVPGFTEALEVLARKPAEYFVKRFERTVWVSPAKTAPMVTPWPADVLPRSGVDASIVAHIATAHFCEHVPYYRLEQQLARTGVSLPRSTQVSLMDQLDTLVAPLIERIKNRVFESGYMHIDATPVDCCDRAHRGAVRPATLWVYRARSPDPDVDGLVWFDCRDDKSPARPRALLTAAAYHGIVQTDGAAGLNTLGPPDQVTHLGCWAHARRYVEEAVRLGDPKATPYLTRVDRLFRIDARARRIVAQVPAHATRVATWRARFSEPLMRTLLDAAAQDGNTLPPKSALGVAIGYLLGQRPSLERCVTTPGARLDNNGAENAIRPLKLGSKNWLFIGHPGAGPRLANLFTLVENCRQAGFDPEAYLIDLVTRLPASSIKRLDDWLPRAWHRVRTAVIKTEEERDVKAGSL